MYDRDVSPFLSITSCSYLCAVDLKLARTFEINQADMRRLSRSSLPYLFLDYFRQTHFLEIMDTGYR